MLRKCHNPAMTRANPQTTFTADEYLVWDAGQDGRHEFIDGDVYAMAGGTLEHNAATGATFAMLRQHLQGTPCRAFVSDVRVHVQASNAMFYPDVVVSCHALELTDGKALTLQQPVLIVEVLSPSTMGYDRGAKFAHYRLLDSLQEYMLIDPDTQQVEVFRRNAANRWELYPSASADATIELASVGWQGLVADVLV